MAINKEEISLDRGALKRTADEYHKSGFNCTQSVICALAPHIDLDPKVAFALTEGFGAGMGGMTETCGAISAAVAALGQVESSGFDTPGSKGRTYKIAGDICKRFDEKNGSTVCRMLRGAGDGVKLRTCPGCIDDAIDIFCDIMIEQGAQEG